jgi:hypothetical protein
VIVEAGVVVTGERLTPPHPRMEMVAGMVANMQMRAKRDGIRLDGLGEIIIVGPSLFVFAAN